MIIKGRSRTGGKALGDYLLSEGRYAKNTDENEQIAIWEGIGIEQGVDLQTLLQSFALTAEDTQCQKPLYHVQIRTAEGEHLTREQWQQTVDRLADKLGLTDHERVIVVHTKDGQDHLHVVWNRINYETGLAAELSFDGRKRLETARELEQEFGLQQLRRARGGKLSATEEAFAHRHGKDPQLLKDIVQICWRHADNGHEFAANLDQYGMTLAKGDKRGFLAVDRDGDFYLVSRTVGAKEKEVRETFKDLDREQLPTLEQARAQQKERHTADLLHTQAADRARLEMKQWRELKSLDDRLKAKAEIQGQLQEARQDERDEREHRRAARLAASLYDRADMVSMQRDAMRELQERVRKRAQDARQEQHPERRAEATTQYQQTAATRLEEKHQQQRDRLEVDQYRARRRARVVDTDRDRAAARLLLPKQFDKAATQATVPTSQDKQQEAPTPAAPPLLVAATNPVPLQAFVTGLPAATGAPARRQLSEADYLRNPKARTEHMQQEDAARHARLALEQIGKDMAAGKALNAEDVKKLRRADLDGIRRNGDAYLRKLVQQHRVPPPSRRKEEGRER